MFYEGGEVHPIRDSPGYSALEDRAHGRERQRRRHHEAQREDYEQHERRASAKRDYRGLQSAILAEGGIRPNADYGRSEIPRDVYRPHGKPADEMAQVLETHGYHFGGDSEMFTELRHRRQGLERLGELKPT
jgi:hypothetical protein